MMSSGGDLAQRGSSALQAPIGPDDRLLADATAALAQISADPVDDVEANRLAIQADDNFEHRVIYRARVLPTADPVRAAIREVRHSTTLVVAAGVFLALIAGAGAARAALAGENGVVNIYWAIAGLLGIQTLMLLVWFILLVISRKAPQNGHVMAIGSLGGLLMRSAGWLATKVHTSATHAAAVSALLRMQVHSPVGRWLLSALSHGLWVSFNLGALVMLIFMLSARQYTFVWETTILSPRQYVPFTQFMAAGPRMLGFATPTREQIEASTKPLDDPATRQVWSSFLLGSVVLYGFGPRLLLLGLCMGLRRRQIKLYRLDLDRPDVYALRSKLMPVAKRIGITHPEGRTQITGPTTTAIGRADPRPLGSPAIVGFEISDAAHGSAWPPAVHAAHWNDLGFVDHRDDQRRVLAQLEAAESLPKSIIVVCSLTTTPDRGVAAFLDQIQRASDRRVRLVLTGGQALRERTDAAGVRSRLQDWRTLAESAGVLSEHVIDVDLQHYTQASAAKLAGLLGDSVQQTSQGSRRIDMAFELIASHADSNTIDEIELNRRIALLYRDEPAGRQGFLPLRMSFEDLKPANLQEKAKSAAGHFIELLPARLRLKPGWMAAGAAAGALSCIAAASLISPAAIAALPMYSLLGATISAAIQPWLSHANAQPSAPTQSDDKQRAIRSSALLVLVLELQGRDEATITRVLDSSVSQVDMPLESPEHVREFLKDLRHRFDMAITSVQRDSHEAWLP